MQPIEHNYSEKRDFIRMKLDTPVTIRCEGRESVALCRTCPPAGCCWKRKVSWLRATTCG